MKSSRPQDSLLTKGEERQDQSIKALVPIYSARVWLQGQNDSSHTDMKYIHSPMKKGDHPRWGRDNFPSCLKRRRRFRTRGGEPMESFTPRCFLCHI